MKFISYLLIFFGVSSMNMGLYTMFLGGNGVDYFDIILTLISIMGLLTLVAGIIALHAITKPPLTRSEARILRRKRFRKALARI